jgi:CDP-glycerol glycerophosphotransferase
MPRISVVVPVYDVEAYLAECLQSVLSQSAADFEVIVVDDGSTDSSATIAEQFGERDARIRLVRQANHGLGHARNTGVTAANGDFLAFVDSDDRLAPEAFARLLGTLERTGSDFAAGNIQRFNRTRTWQAGFVRKTFWRRRARTHVTRFRWLLHDRMAQNKLWRRSFWDEHALRFPEGCLHEDIPLVIPAHFMARSVDVLPQPVYLYREREDGSSITQHRATLRTLEHRFAACQQVRDHLERQGPPDARRWYDQTLVNDDFRYHLDVLGEADDAYRAAFMARAGAFLADADPDVEARMPPIQRLKWGLVREQRLDDLLAVLRNPGAAIPRRTRQIDLLRRRARQAVMVLAPLPAPVQQLRQPPQQLRGAGGVREEVDVALHRQPRHEDRLLAGVLPDPGGAVPDAEAG